MAAKSPEAVERQGERTRRYYRENRERVLEQQHDYHARNRGRRSQQAKARYRTDPEPAKARARTRSREARTEINAYLRSKYGEDPVPFKERRRAAQRKLREDVIKGYGGRCACCGNDFLPHLTLDHVNGGGAEERRLAGGGRGVYARLRREGYPTGYQILCWNCNAAKHHYGTCRCQEVSA